MTRRKESQFDGDPASVRKAREFVEATLAAWDVDDIQELALLLTSEVASNAVMHARTAYRLALEFHPPEVHIEVRDGSPELPRAVQAEPDWERGRGLALVEKLAARWGARLEEGGKAVWFVLKAGTSRIGWVATESASV